MPGVLRGKDMKIVVTRVKSHGEAETEDETEYAETTAAKRKDQ